MPPQKEPRLLSLPRELRDQIYDQIFLNTTASLDDPGHPTPPGILLTCKQTYTESLPACYHHTHFRTVRPMLVIPAFFARLNPASVPLVQTISIDCFSQPYFPSYRITDQPFDAYETILELRATMKAIGIPTPRDGVLKVTIQVGAAADAVVCTATPWQTFVQHYSQNPWQTEATFIENDDTLEKFQNQSRYFDHDHSSMLWYLCWNTMWFDASYDCGCPKKAN